METAVLLKNAWEAVVESGVPANMQDAAFKAAIGHLNGTGGKPSSGSSITKADTVAVAQKAGISKKRTTAKRQSNGTNVSSSTDAVLSQMPDETTFFAAVAKETDVSEADLRDVFHIADGKLELKVASKDLGDSAKAATVTVTALVAGAVFAGTDHKSLPVGEVHDVCRAKRCHGDTNASKYVRATPNLAVVGSGSSSALTHRSGWQSGFAKTVDRVLGKSDDDG